MLRRLKRKRFVSVTTGCAWASRFLATPTCPSRVAPACVACHQPNQGFAGNHGSRIGVALGSQPGALGLRNAMTNSYVGLIPAFSFETVNGETEAVGGLFWDGRANTMAEQALGPLLNPLEMNNPSRRAVVDKIAASRYAPLFRQQFGEGIFNNTDAAFTQIGVAIEAFERATLQPFSSKFDAMVRGAVAFTPHPRRVAWPCFKTRPVPTARAAT
jgi:cytochrome c peroxidase